MHSRNMISNVQGVIGLESRESEKQEKSERLFRIAGRVLPVSSSVAVSSLSLGLL